MTPSISILITYHNEAEMLTECLASIAAQTVPVDEILVYDDASRLPAADYIPASCKVRVFRGEKNLGPAPARNYLAKHAASGYIHFHDADDWLFPNWCREVKGRIQSTGCDVLYTEETEFLDGMLVKDRIIGLARLAAGEDIVRFCLSECPLPSCAIYRREAFLKAGGYREDLWLSEEYDLNIRLALVTSYAIIETSLVGKRVRPGSHSKDQVRIWVDATDSLTKLLPQMPGKYRQDAVNALARVARNLAALGKTAEAELAFAAAAKFGKPTLPNESFLYRMAVSCGGHGSAERLGRWWRTHVPAPLRKLVRLRTS